MNEIFRRPIVETEMPTSAPVNLSRRGFLLPSAGALVIGFGMLPRTTQVSTTS